MSFTEMKIQGAWIHNPLVHPDNRGTFHEVFRISEIEKQLGRTFPVKQVNQSTSHKGVIRGIHYTDSAEGQAKYVSCLEGAIWDIVVDLRKDSPTYGNWDAFILSAENNNSVLLSEGLGHAFLSLTDNAVVSYLCTSEYSPEHDKTVNVFSSSLEIDFSSIAKEYEITSFKFSEKDENAVGF